MEQTAGRLVPKSQWPVVELQMNTRSGQTWDEARGVGSIFPMPAYPGPKDLPYLRMHLLDKWQEGGSFERMVYLHDPGDPVQNISASERMVLAHASLWWVQEDMVSLVTQAGKMFNKMEAKAIDIQLPCDQKLGLVCFQTPWVGTDARLEDHMVRVHALSWSVGRVSGVPCLSMTMYSYIDFAEGMDRYQLQEVVESGLLGEGNLEGMPSGHEELSTRLRGGAWVLLGHTDWPLQETIGDFATFASHDDPQIRSKVTTQTSRASMIEDRKFLAAFCTLINQVTNITNIEEHPIPNHQQKQIDRHLGVKTTKEERKKRKIPTVRLIRLRKHHKPPVDPRDPDAPKKIVNWTHRWISSGHWGWRWFGKGKKQKRLVFIPPSIKGPEDMPLIVKDTVRTWIE
jgi:hypothetical protein